MSAFQIDSLILIIGTNPLPNYVVAKYFLQEEKFQKNIFFIYTKETQIYAYNIDKILQKEKFSYLKNLVEIEKEDDERLIECSLKESLFPKLKGDKIHLNYTGGTKVMVTKIYQALQMYCAEKFISFSTSYLSKSDFALKFMLDKEYWHSTDLRKSIRISFEDLFVLHDFQKKPADAERITNIVFFEDLIKNDRLNDYFDSEYGYERSNFLNNKNDLIENFNYFKKKFPEEKSINSPIVIKAISSLKPDFKLYDKFGKLNPLTNAKIKSLTKYLAGDWFEEYIFKNLVEFIDLNTFSINSNVRINKPAWDSYEFELDILLLCGYQLIGISITTSNNSSLCKSKGFEIIHRASQIGGDEAKMILITLLENEKKEKLKKGIEYDNGSGTQILVLGREDIKPELLKMHIINFLEK